MNGNARQTYQRNSEHLFRMGEIALRSTALLWDLQADTARHLLQMQASTARAFGAPDFSRVFQNGNGHGKGMFSAGIDQALNAFRQLSDTVNEAQGQFAQAAERRTHGLAQNIQETVEVLSRRSRQGLEEIRHLAEEESAEMEAAVAEHQEVYSEALQEGERQRTTHKRRGRSRRQSHRRAA